MKYWNVVKPDQLYNISKFHLILFCGQVIIIGKNPGMEYFGMILVLTKNIDKFLG